MAGLEEPSAEIPEMMRSARLMLAKHWQALDAAERAADSKSTGIGPRSVT
jgi:hypothetical protein